MRSLTIGNKNTLLDYRLVMTRFSLEIPEVKRYTVDLPGGHGELDFTDFFGEPKLSNRLLDVDLVYRKFPGPEIPQDVMHSILNEWHGRRLDIVDSLDPDHKLVGRVMLADLDGRKTVAKIRLQAVCDPYRLETSPTVLSGVIPSGGELLLTADILRMPVVPEITVSSATAVTYNDEQHVIQAGTYPLWTKLTEGEQVLKFVGAEGTTVSVNYVRGLI